MDEQEVQGSAPAEPTTGEPAAMTAEAPKKPSSTGTILALLFMVAALAFAGYMLFFKDYDPYSGVAKSMKGKKAEEYIAKVGKPFEEVSADDFPKKYPFFQYQPEPLPVEEKILVYKHGPWFVFVYINFEGNLYYVVKSKFLKDGPNDEEITMFNFENPVLQPST